MQASCHGGAVVIPAMFVLVVCVLEFFLAERLLDFQ